MSMAHKKILKKYDIPQNKEREALEERLAEWEAAVGEQAFRGGESPDLSDISVFGCVDGLRELPIYGELEGRAKFGSWLRRMDGAMAERKGE